ncbi:MAG: metal-dependent transcriptional regulator [Anaerolineales bacterium]|jgi:DtxR family Mn-dependent transcriptional regulator
MNGRKTSGRSVEMYLKSIHELSMEDKLVPISTLAERLAISVVSATEMIHRLEKRRLIERLPYKGVRLSEEGRRRALEVVRRHRLWENFLSNQLDLPWAMVHDMACALEHAAGPEVSEALAAHLGQPTTCPHGNPIPTRDGKLVRQDEMGLHQLGVGDRSVIQRIRLESGTVLSRSASLGLKPGVTVLVEEIDPLDSLRTIRTGEKQVVVGHEMATHIMVQPLEPQNGDVA